MKTVHRLLLAALSLVVHIELHNCARSSAHAFIAILPSTSPILPSQSSSRSASAAMTMMASSPRGGRSIAIDSGTTASIPPPPPPLSMPVWSLSCPVPFRVGRSVDGAGRSPSSSMSIVTYATPVSLSSSRLWAISLYKTTLTRCSLLGIPTPGEEYNDMPSVSSSVTTTAGFSPGVRRRVDMGEAGTLGVTSVEGSAGWRRRRTTTTSGISSGVGVGGGVGVLQLLKPDQAKLVPILGKSTGWDVGSIDKREGCAALGNEWTTVAGGREGLLLDVLPNCASYLQVRLKRVTDGGDHDVAICEVITTGVWNDAEGNVRWLSDDDDAGNHLPALDHTTALYSGQLRDEGII